MPDVTIIGAPTSAGAYAPGQESAPTALREAGLVDALEAQGLDVSDAGDGPLRRWTPDPAHPRAQNVRDVADAVRDADSAVSDALDNGGLVLVLGGDCTVGTASFQALRRKDESAALCYLDLDADMNTPHSSRAGALDWMGLGMLLGVEGAVEGVVELGQLDPRRLVQIGLWDDESTAWELDQLARRLIEVVRSAEVSADPAAAAGRALASLPQDTGSIAVHFDVDVIDFVDAPLSEDTNRNIGLTLDDAATCLAALMGDRRVRVLTVTELNPHHGAADGSTLRRFVAHLAHAIAARFSQLAS